MCNKWNLTHDSFLRTALSLFSFRTKTNHSLIQNRQIWLLSRHQEMKPRSVFSRTLSHFGLLWPLNIYWYDFFSPTFILKFTIHFETSLKHGTKIANWEHKRVAGTKKPENCLWPGPLFLLHFFEWYIQIRRCHQTVKLRVHINLPNNQKVRVDSKCSLTIRRCDLLLNKFDWKQKSFVLQRTM